MIFEKREMKKRITKAQEVTQCGLQEVAPEYMRGVEKALQNIIKHIYGREDLSYPSWDLTVPNIKEEERYQW